MAVTINGRAYPVKFSLNTRRLFCREKEIELSEFEQMFRGGDDDVTLDQIENMAGFFLWGFREGARKAGSTCDLTLDDVVELFSDDPAAIADILKEYRTGEMKGPEQGEAQSPAP